MIESKVFSFSAGSNERGTYVRIFESGGGYPSGGSSLMIPCGWSNSYLKMFCDTLEKMARHLSQDGSMVSRSPQPGRQLQQRATTQPCQASADERSDAASAFPAPASDTHAVCVCVLTGP